ncbi:MAG: hypothetical protein RI955_731 [Bacteroidota bacterium]
MGLHFFKFMNRIFFLIAFFLMSNFLQAQTINVQTICSLPAILSESSGVEMSNVNKLWSHNDSGGNPELYAFDTLGNVLKTLQINNATNTDWEEIKQNSVGDLFIDNMGNNNNDRTDLRIYKIGNPNLISSNSTSATTIKFTYPDQFYFPPAKSQYNFDCEAFVAYSDSLYLFSKDRSTPYKGYTKLYRLPTQAGSYVATLLDSFYTGNTSISANSITSAALSPNGSQLILISDEACWLFTNFNQRNFLKGSVQKLIFNCSLTHKEGVVFINENELYLTDEKQNPGEGNLYRISLPIKNVFAESTENIDGWSVYPNPANEELKILKSEDLKIKEIQVLNIIGQVVFNQQVNNSTTQLISTSSNLIINTSLIPRGIYFLKATDDKGYIHTTKFVKQ